MIIQRNKDNGQYYAFQKLNGSPCLAEGETRLDAVLELRQLMYEVAQRQANKKVTLRIIK